MTLGSFVAFWGWVFVLTTVAVWLGKRELPRPDASAAPHTYALANRSEEAQDEDAVQEEDMGVWDTYRAMWAVLRKPAVQSLAVVLLTSKVGFAAADALTGLKLQEGGLRKEGLAVLGVIVTPVALLVPAVVAKYTHGERPLGIFLLAFPYRLAVGLLLAGLVWSVPAHVVNGDATPGLYAALVVCFVAHQVPPCSATRASASARRSPPCAGSSRRPCAGSSRRPCAGSFAGRAWPGAAAGVAVPRARAASPPAAPRHAAVCAPRAPWRGIEFGIES